MAFVQAACCRRQESILYGIFVRKEEMNFWNEEFKGALFRGKLSFFHNHHAAFSIRHERAVGKSRGGSDIEDTPCFPFQLSQKNQL